MLKKHDCPLNNMISEKEIKDFQEPYIDHFVASIDLTIAMSYISMPVCVCE